MNLVQMFEVIVDGCKIKFTKMAKKILAYSQLLICNDN